MMTFMLVKTMAVTLWLLASAQAWVLAATDPSSQPDRVNVILNFASLAILIGGLVLAPKALKSRSAQAQLVEKDQVIATKEQMAKAREEETTLLKDRLRDMGMELDMAQRDYALWRGRYEEQAKYTAGPALQAISELLERTEQMAERRHVEMMELLAKIPPRV